MTPISAGMAQFRMAWLSFRFSETGLSDRSAVHSSSRARGLELSAEIDSSGLNFPFATLEAAFLAVYVVELLIRFYAHGLARLPVLRSDIEFFLFQTVMEVEHFPQKDGWLAQLYMPSPYYSTDYFR